MMFAVEATRDGKEVKVAFLRQCLQQLRAAYPPEQGRMTAVPHGDYSEAEQLPVYAPVEEKMAPPPPLRVLGAAPNPTHNLPFQIPR
ncbi:hypothetical protein LJR084_006292 [Variovorax sp. LjRoot84]|uniref:hypothetical protein n=1 Tax=Variovorax sp. LjRoot84 TaxID=3342340 RepID=UPI003ED05C73